MSKSYHKVRRVECDDGHDTNCMLRCYGGKPDEAVVVPREERVRLLHRDVLIFVAEEELATRAKRLCRDVPGLVDGFPILPEFDHLKGYDRALEFFIERSIGAARSRRELALDPCEECGQELSLWEWWEVIKVIEGQDERVTPVEIVERCSTEKEAQQHAG